MFFIKGETLREKKRSKDDFKNKIMALQNFMKSRNINRQLREQIFRHYNYIFKHSASHGTGGMYMLSQMPESLKQAVTIELYYSFIKNQPYFSETFDPKFLYNLCSLVKEIELGSGMSIDETVFSSKESFNESVIFVISGQVALQLTSKVSQQNQSGQIYKKGDCINLHLFVTGQQESMIPKLKSNTVVTLAYIERSKFVQLLNDFPQEKEKFFQSQDQVALGGTRDILRQKCACCGKCQHQANQCALIHATLNRDKIIYNNNLSTVQPRDVDFIRRRMKASSGLKFMLIEMSPDYIPTLQDYNLKRGFTQIINKGQSYGGERRESQLIQIAPSSMNECSVKLMSSQKNQFSTIANTLQNVNNCSQAQDITSLLQPYSISDIPSTHWIGQHSKQVVNNLKGIDLIQKSRNKYSTMKSRTIGSQGIIQQSESINNSVAFSKQKQPTHLDLDIFDSSLSNSDRKHQKPLQIDNHRMKLKQQQYFNEDDIEISLCSNHSLDNAQAIIPIQLLGQYTNSNIVYSQQPRSPSKRLSYGYKFSPSQLQNQVSQLQNQANSDETKYNLIEQLYSPKHKSNNNINFKSNQQEESKNTEPPTIGKIQSDLSVIIKQDQLTKSITKRTQITNSKFGSQKTIYAGLIKPIEGKNNNNNNNNNSHSSNYNNISNQNNIINNNNNNNNNNTFYYKKGIPTSQIIPSQTHLSFLEEKCCEMDLKKDYAIYFSHYNCDIIIQKHNDKSMKISLKSSGKKIHQRRVGISNHEFNQRISFIKQTPLLKI